jgi:hypothetical protein
MLANILFRVSCLPVCPLKINRVLRTISGPKREEVAGGWRRLQNERLQNVCPSQNIIRMIKSRRMRWVGHVTGTGEVKSA